MATDINVIKATLAATLVAESAMGGGGEDGVIVVPGGDGAEVLVVPGGEGVEVLVVPGGGGVEGVGVLGGEGAEGVVAATTLIANFWPVKQ